MFRRALLVALLVSGHAQADVLIETRSSNELVIDIREEHIADTRFGSIQTTVTLAAALPDRWYYGWLWQDECGAVGFQLLLDDAPPPDQPYRRIVTAVRTDHGAAINPRYRQIGPRVWFDRDYELLRGNHATAWIAKGFVPNTHASDGSAPLIPTQLAPIWYARANALRESSAGVGLAQITLGMIPADTGSYSTTVKGYANTESTAAGHAQDELLVHHRLGESTFGVSIASASVADLYVTGFQLAAAGILVETTGATKLHVDVRDAYVADGHFTTLETDATLAAPVANRWYYGWLWIDDNGNPGFELRLDDAPPPTKPFRRILTAARTGPSATIWPRYRQVDERVSFDADVTVMERVHGTSSWLEHGLRATNQAEYGSELLIPRNLATVWYARGEAMRASGQGVGIGQINLGMIATSGVGAYSVQIKGYANTEDTGRCHGQDEVAVQHRLGTTTFGYYFNAAMANSVFVTGYQLGTGPGMTFESDQDSAVKLHIDIHDLHVAGGQLASLDTTYTLANATPDRWHYGWLWSDGSNVGFEVRRDDAPPPDKPYRRIVTAFQVNADGNIVPHYRQVDTHVWFDGDYEHLLWVGGTDAWVERGFDQLSPDLHLPMIPKDVSPLWYTRSETANRSSAGAGLAEIAFGAVPSDTGSYATSIAGYADTEPPGSPFVNDELPVHHELGRSTFSFRATNRTVANILFAGFELMGALPGTTVPMGCAAQDGQPDGGVSPPGVDGSTSAGCCDAGSTSGSAPLLWLVVAMLLVRRRRVRRRRLGLRPTSALPREHVVGDATGQGLRPAIQTTGGPGCGGTRRTSTNPASRSACSVCATVHSGLPHWAMCGSSHADRARSACGTAAACSCSRG